MTRNERLTATFDGTFVIFLIGMRINKPLLVHKWLPVAMAMPRMIKELYQHPELGFVHAESWVGRTTMMVQYWRSLDQLLAYARAKETEHLPAWSAFNKAVGTNGTVGIWHETYVAAPGSYENMYINMPPFGLGQVGTVSPATGRKHTAAARMRLHQHPLGAPSAFESSSHRRGPS
jgi:Domain of unknown function (DUF4188)